MPVVSLKRTSGRHSPTLATAPARCTIAFDFSGTEPWPEMPCDDELDAARNLLERLHGRVLDLSADARHAAAFGEAVLRVDLGKVLLRPGSAMPPLKPPSSPASETKITSRSSGTFSRFSSSIVISAAVRLSLSSTVPRP